jgi:deoxyribodipyrimidine photo-lyase
MLNHDNNPVSVVYFKRDLRIQDNQALSLASQSGNTLLLLYIFEPELIHSGHWSERHTRFVMESLRDLQIQLSPFGHKIHTFYGNPVDVFAELISQIKIKTVYSHLETGVNLTFQRDKNLTKLFESYQIQWHEFRQNGVFRRLSDRKGWNKQWHVFMNSPQSDTDLRSFRSFSEINSLTEKFNTPDEILNISENSNFQKGGERTSHLILNNFLNFRSLSYRRNISKPEVSRISCSRLSPYLAWGNISIRAVYQAADRHSKIHASSGLSAFLSRLHWHCHFIQKFES